MVSRNRSHLVWHMRGYEILMTKAEEIINSSQKEVLISFWEKQAKELESSLTKAVRRRVKVINLQFGHNIVNVGTVYSHILLDTVYKRHGHELNLVVDDKYGFFMNLVPDSEWEGYWTSNQGVIKMITNYIRHDIYVNVIVQKFKTIIFNEYGSQLEKLLNI